MANEFLKIWFSDIESANDFFDGNQKHLGEFMVNVYRSYAELPTHFTCKLVAKYFKTYTKHIDYIKNAKVTGKEGGFGKHEKQEVNQDTLVGVVVDPLVESLPSTLLPKDKSKRLKVKSEKEIELDVADKSASIETRDLNFRDEIALYLDDFSKETCRAFYNYWSEKNKTGTKMKFELEKTFEVKKRLTTWKSREGNFSKGGFSGPVKKSNIEVLAESFHDDSLYEKYLREEQEEENRKNGTN